MYKDTSHWIATLEKSGELVRIKERIDPRLEITEITDRISKQNGPALLFENTGTDFPVLINSMGTEKRMAMALGVDKIDDVGASMESLFKELLSPKDSNIDKLKLLPKLSSIASWMPKVISGKGACQEIINQDPDLTKLPVLTCWPEDGGPFITLPVIHTVDPNTGIRNVGMYRMQVFGPKLTGMHWHRHKVSARHMQEYKKLGKKMPVAVALGGDPVYAYSATAPLPDGVDEYMLAGFLRKKKVELVQCITQPIQVPADADIIIEGYVDPEEEFILEGPFGDHTGYYNSVERFPVFTLSAITMRRQPIYLSTFTGRPPDEPSVLGEALNEVFIPLFQQQFPEIVDFWLPPEGCSYRIAVVSMKKAYAGHAKRVMMGVWSYLRQFMYTKWVIVVDADIDARNWKDVMWALSTRMDPARDITVIENTPIDYLDFASPVSGLGSKIGLDATDKFPGETNREWGRQIRMDQAVIDRVDAMWSNLGLPGSGRKIWR